MLQLIEKKSEIGNRLSNLYSQVHYIRIEQRGRGRALRHVWSLSQADIVGYMDIDLSTNLSALPPLVNAIHKHGYDLSIGSRLSKGSVVIGRSFKRELVSRSYSLLFRSLFFTSFRDAQCGFKAVSRKVCREVLPEVKDTGWFFDSELLILSDKNGYSIKEIPVQWGDDPDTKVKIIGTARENLRGLLRLRFGGLKHASQRIQKYKIASDIEVL